MWREYSLKKHSSFRTLQNSQQDVARHTPEGADDFLLKPARDYEPFVFQESVLHS